MRGLQERLHRIGIEEIGGGGGEGRAVVLAGVRAADRAAAGGVEHGADTPAPLGEDEAHKAALLDRQQLGSLRRFETRGAGGVSQRGPDHRDQARVERASEGGAPVFVHGPFDVAVDVDEAAGGEAVVARDHGAVRRARGIGGLVVEHHGQAEPGALVDGDPHEPEVLLGEVADATAQADAGAERDAGESGAGDLAQLGEDALVGEVVVPEHECVGSGRRAGHGSPKPRSPRN
ncbi:hypothetical protein E9998_01140 [Glycomyces paridis]|uniref:Uncharacterized protein n=1 Tax=Glycomyces paridis TaxID=2126555 RepID=A0A4S8PV05_9ACTN|nr:hypothetical protein E9998_01140 [Glycomyces paridis]